MSDPSRVPCIGRLVSHQGSPPQLSMKHLLLPSIVLGGGLLVDLVPAPTPGGLPQSALCPQLEHVTLSLGSSPPGGSEHLLRF